MQQARCLGARDQVSEELPVSLRSIWMWVNGIIDSVDMRLRKLREIAKGREAWWAAVHGVTESGTAERLHSRTDAQI